VTPFYEAIGPSSFGWVACRVFHNQLSRYRLGVSVLLRAAQRCAARHVLM